MITMHNGAADQMSILIDRILAEIIVLLGLFCFILVWDLFLCFCENFELQDWVAVKANFCEINSSWSTINYGVKTRQTTVLIVFSVRSLLFAFIAIVFSYIFCILWMYAARYWTDKRLFQCRLAQCARFNRVNFVSVCFVCWLVAHYGNVMHQWKELRKKGANICSIYFWIHLQPHRCHAV